MFVSKIFSEKKKATMKHIIKLTNAEENFKKEKVRTQNKLPRKFSIL